MGEEKDDKDSNPRKRKLEESESSEVSTSNEASEDTVEENHETDEKMRSPTKPSPRKRKYNAQTVTPTKVKPTTRARFQDDEKPYERRKRRVSFSTVDLHEFEQRIGPESHGVPDEGASSLYMGSLISSSPKIDLDKYMKKRKETSLENEGSYLSPEKRQEVACNPMTQDLLDKSSKLLEQLRASREVFGCQCVPPMFLTVPELKNVLKKNGKSGYSKLKKSQLIKEVEKIKGKSCCTPNSGCECFDNGIGCYSESCTCLTYGGKKLCRNKFGKKMFQQPRGFGSRKTKSILKQWDAFYTPETDRTFSYRKRIKKKHATKT